MIYSQQRKGEQPQGESLINDWPEYTLQQLQGLKAQQNQERHCFIVFLSEYIIESIQDSNHGTCDDQLVQIIKNTCLRIIEKPLWNLEDIIEEIQQQLETSIDDFIVVNQVKLIMSSFNTEYSVKFNQISASYLQILKNHKLKQDQKTKRVCQYTEIHELLPNHLDRVDEIFSNLQPFIQLSDPQIQVDTWCPMLQLFQESNHYTVKKLNVDLILIDTYGIDQQTAQILFLLFPEYERNLPSLISTINISKGNVQYAVQHVYDMSQNSVDWSQLLIKRGKGLVCCNNEGFTNSEFINFYFGEVYTPQRWFEKQTVFQKRMQDGNRKQCSLSPYAEFFINDDLLFIDPSRFGNYSQHINYSCSPNCRLVTVNVNGQNLLAVITTKKVHYLEELTLPFPKTSQQPCYCGSVECQRQQYLEQYQSQLISQYPNYIQRNVILLRSTLMIDNYEWLNNWKKLTQSQDHINILSCVDKVKFILQYLKTDQPPIFLVNDVYDVFWKSYEETRKVHLDVSIFNEIKIFLTRYKHIKECKQGLEIMQIMKQLIDSKNVIKMQLTRLLLLILSEFILNIENCTFNNQAFSTILYFMAFTHTYFSSTQYQGFESKPFEENEFEYIPQPKNKQKLTLSKLYTPQFIWGQLINWNKQTLQNPQSSMAQERRNILCYPSLILSFDNKHKTFPYQCKTREKYLEYFRTKKDIQPDLSSWSYKNQYNIYGTIFFEQYFSLEIVGSDFIEQIMRVGVQDFSSKLSYWFNIENCFAQDPAIIEELQSIYEKNFKKSLDSIQIHIYDLGHNQKKKVKYNNETPTTIDETQFGSY